MFFYFADKRGSPGKKLSSKSRDHNLAIIRSTAIKPNQPVLEVYNMYNRVIDGSILQGGDTRVFFLRKRQRASEQIRRSLTSAVLEEREIQKNKQRRGRRQRRSKPLSLLSLEELVPERVSLHVLNELDQMAKEEKQPLPAYYV